MAIDLTGIHNVNEFYTDHYLATYFEQSVTETLRAWRADAEASGGQTPTRGSGMPVSSTAVSTADREIPVADMPPRTQLR